MNKFLSFLIAFVAVVLFTNSAKSQCIPTGTRPVSGTISAASGTFTVMNVPTGNVVQINCPAANTQYFIDLCITNPGTNVPDGTNDGHLSVLDQNSASAAVLTSFEDGCTNILGNGWGPPVGTWTAPAAGTYFLYLTEWDAIDQCLADGVNSDYDFSITITPPPAGDLAVDSAFLPAGAYSSVTLQQLNFPLSVGARLKNNGSAAASSVAVTVRIRNMISNTIVSNQTISGPASLAPGATALVSNSGFTPPFTTGAYEFRYICSMTQTDGNKTNDTAFRYILIDPNLLANDLAIITGNLNNALGYTSPVIFGQKYPVINNTQVDTVSGYFIMTGANLGQSVRAVIYNTAGGVPTTQLAVSPNHLITPADTGGRFIRFPFQPNVNLTAGNTYFIGIEQLGNSNMGLAYVANNVVGGNTMLSLSPYTTWTPSSAVGFPGSMLIWVKTNWTCTLVADGTGNNASCQQNNASASLSLTGANGTATYLWSNGATGSTISNVAPGTYTATVTAGGCQDTAQVVLSNIGTQPSVTFSTSNANCGASDGSITANASGGTSFTYVWNIAGNGATLQNVAGGSYNVTVTNENNCSVSSSGFVNSSGAPTVSASSTPALCYGASTGTLSASASGGTAPYSFTWSGSLSGSPVNNVAAGNYIVTVTDASNCQSTASVSVSQPDSVSANITSTPVSCFNGTDGGLVCTSGGGVGNFSYQWTTGASIPTVTGLGAGNYCVTVTDANGCSTSVCSTLTNPVELTASTVSTDATCFGSTNGKVTLTASGGTGTLTYLWSNSAATANLNNVAANNYTVTVTDTKGCTITASATVAQPTALTATTDCLPTILGQATGSATVAAQGGTAPYTYSWSNSTTGSTASNLSSGIFTVTVTDANSCSVTADCEVQFVSGIEENNAGISALNIFPNPTNGTLNINLSLYNTSNLEVTLTDVRGAIVISKNLKNVSAMQQQIDLSNQAKGVYTLRLTTAQGSVSKRVVVQ